LNTGATFWGPSLDFTGSTTGISPLPTG
jgi:hypothetical protein